MMEPRLLTSPILQQGMKHPAGMKLDPVSSLAFSGVAGRIRRAEGLARGALALERQDPDAHAYSVRFTVADKHVPADGLPDFVRNAGTPRGSAMLQKDPEFVAPQAGYRVARPHSTPEDGAELPQQLVSGEVPAGIVDRLKAIEVKKSQNVFHPSIGGPRESPSETPLELGPVHQPGQRVVGRTVR
jgi:hypothetical protein